MVAALNTLSWGTHFRVTTLAESLHQFNGLAVGETAATGAKRRWNAEGAVSPAVKPLK
jgi:hypothetical protein